MKKSLPIFIIAALLTVGCKVQVPYVPSIMHTSAIDYSQFNGFFLTESNSVSFPYDPIASVRTIHLQGVDGQEFYLFMKDPGNDTSGRKVHNDDVYGPPRKQKKGDKIDTSSKAVKVTLKGALADLVNNARALGANGVINLDIQMINDLPGPGGTQVTHGYRISGMAIKR